MSQGRGLSDFVPVVLDGSVPEFAGQRLVCASGRAAGDPECFDQVEGVGVPVARQFWRTARTELVRSLQGKRSDARPARELWLWREIRRRRLVVSRGIPENIGRRWVTGAVVRPYGQDPIGDSIPYADAVSLSLVGQLRQGLLKLGVEEGCLKIRIQLDQYLVRCRRRCRLL